MLFPPSRLKTPAPPDDGEVNARGDAAPGEDEQDLDLATMATVAPGDLDTGQDPGCLIGKVLDGRNLVLWTLGEGGMGAVYLVEHTTINKKFALKVLHEAAPSKRQHLQAWLPARAA